MRECVPDGGKTAWVTSDSVGNFGQCGVTSDSVGYLRTVWGNFGQCGVTSDDIMQLCTVLTRNELKFGIYGTPGIDR